MTRTFALPAVSFLIVVVLSGCMADDEGDERSVGDAAEGLTVTSSAFGDGERIPDKYTCAGADIKPPLRISGIPDETLSVALIVDDPDAPSGTWTHYTVWNIPPDDAEWDEGTDLRARDAVEGATSFEDGAATGYGGPCPPPGDEPHRYFFRAYALDDTLELEEGASRGALEDEMERRLVAQGELVGTYGREG